MTSRLYIISCDNIEIFNSFISILQSRIAGIKIKDYSKIRFKRLTAGMQNAFTPSNKNDINIINKVSKIIDDYNNGIFNTLIDEINISKDDKVYMFIRVDDLHQMNKLKRVFKRPNYKTVRLFDNNRNISKKKHREYKMYKFDSKIEYISNKHLLTQTKLFIQKHIPTIKTIKN